LVRRIPSKRQSMCRDGDMAICLPSSFFLLTNCTHPRSTRALPLPLFAPLVAFGGLPTSTLPLLAATSKRAYRRWTLPWRTHLCRQFSLGPLTKRLKGSSMMDLSCAAPPALRAPRQGMSKSSRLRAMTGPLAHGACRRCRCECEGKSELCTPLADPCRMQKDMHTSRGPRGRLLSVRDVCENVSKGTAGLEANSPFDELQCDGQRQLAVDADHGHAACRAGTRATETPDPRDTGQLPLCWRAVLYPKP
jgi:hypothetical protein